MKTQNQFKEMAHIVTNLTARLLPVALICCFSVSIAQRQKLNIGASFGTAVTGSGLGVCLSPQLTLNTSSHNFSAGVNIQSHHGNMTGFRGGYELIMNPFEMIDVFLFYDISLHKDAYLGRYTALMEGRMNPESAGYFNSVRVNTMEQHVGFGMNAYVLGPLKVFWKIGVGHYTTTGNPNQSFQYRERSNCSVMLMAGLKMAIKRIK